MSSRIRQRLNAEQVKAKKADAKAVSSKIHEEGASGTADKGNSRKSCIDSGRIGNLRKIRTRIDGTDCKLSKELDQERERESKQLLESEKVHLAYAAMERECRFLVENEQRIQEEITKFNENI